jgi:hypothetical protein
MGTETDPTRTLAVEPAIRQEEDIKAEANPDAEEAAEDTWDKTLGVALADEDQ